MFVMVFVAETIIISVMVSIVFFFSTGKIFSKGFIYSLLSQCAHKQYQYYTIHNVYGIMFYRHISDEQTPVIQ